MRKTDSGWRDAGLAAWHESRGIGCPAPGMSFVMVEYDRGQPVGIVNYIRRGETLPRGEDVARAYAALGDLVGCLDGPLPFFTAVYDPYNWAFTLYAHNNVARAVAAMDGKVTRVSEYEFVSVLYRMRGRYIADELDPSVVLYADGWNRFRGPVPGDEAWPGQFLSIRRREYEPEHQARWSSLLPCVDIDLAVVDERGKLALVADYKSTSATARRNTSSSALGNLYAGGGAGYSERVPAFLVRGGTAMWHRGVMVHPLNLTGTRHLSFALGHLDADPTLLSEVITGQARADVWHQLTESQWSDVLIALA